ncbi:FG-GAP repeat domain-containing protein [Micromonospora sp. NPDC005806]|uniref:FG-GAP repeat domain-containing protein n=1 Tax=Micromonospora sp. NPDC005806 TaxID=3364234 RepID=UPI0036C72FDA
MGRSLSAGALACTASLALSLLVVPGTPAVADPSTAPREVTVIPQDEPTALPMERLWLAGKTGFLHQHNAAKNYLWTRYDTGETMVVEELTGLSSTALRPAGGDTISIWQSVPGHPVNATVNVLDLGDRSWEQWPRPTDGSLFAVQGRELVVRQGTKLELRTVGTDGSVVASRPVTGLPSGEIALTTEPLADDGTSMVLEMSTMDGLWWGVLDLASARIVQIPDVDLNEVNNFKVSGDTVAWISHDGTVHAYSRKGLLTGTETTVRTANVGTAQRYALVGDRVLGVVDKRNGKQQGLAVTVPLGGTTQEPALPLASLLNESIVQGPDGSALLVGGSSSRDWAVHRFTPTDAAPAHVPVLPVRDPVGNAALSYRHGIVAHLQTQVAVSGATQYALYNHAVAADDGSGDYARQLFPVAGTLSANTAPCAPQVACVRMLDGSEGPTYVTHGPSGETAVVGRLATDHATPVPTAYGRLVDSDERYAIVDGGSPAVQYVVDMPSRRVELTGPITGAAVWYDTVWTATTTPGQLKQVGLGANATQRVVSTGVACVPTELQASTRWLYWSCGGTAAGVYDLTANRNITLPAGPALLGDGFLVRHDADGKSLLMTDFHDGTVRTAVKLADLPVGAPADDRGISWTVDRAGAGVAYVDAANAVHVLDSGVPSTPPAVGFSSVGRETYPRHDVLWNAYLKFTRPVSSWRATITHKATGRTFPIASGGPVREGVHVSWNGWLPEFRMADNGGYRWTVTGTSDAGATVTIGSGTVLSTCGTFPFRTWDCYGGQALLGVRSTGVGRWYGQAPGTEPAGGLSNLGDTDTWCLSCTGTAGVATLVPFGDLDEDGMPDLLVVDKVGYLRVFLGTGRNGFPKSTTKSITLGRGWLAYRLLVAPGDLNGDRRPDLLGVGTDGKLWLYTANGGGGFSTRVQIGSGWGVYPKVVGAGDLNGDGNGDLLGIDAAGVMYRYFSDGARHFSSRVKVSAGWNIYNTVLAIGDLNQDGRHDLLARDANGLLWFYAGRGDGTFASRVQRGSGWNGFARVV